MLGSLRTPENRDMVKSIGVGIFVSAGILCTAFVYFGGKSWVRSLFKHEATFDICQGEYRQGCAGSPHFINCETNIVAWIKTIRPDICVNVLAKKLSVTPGDMCGYSTFEIKCSSR